MKATEIQALLNDPACTHNAKEKSGCARPKPGATAGACSFDGALKRDADAGRFERMADEGWQE